MLRFVNNYSNNNGEFILPIYPLILKLNKVFGKVRNYLLMKWENTNVIKSS